jgi:hypothetical protein
MTYLYRGFTLYISDSFEHHLFVSHPTAFVDVGRATLCHGMVAKLGNLAGYFPIGLVHTVPLPINTSSQFVSGGRIPVLVWSVSSPPRSAQ